MRSERRPNIARRISATDVFELRVADSELVTLAYCWSHVRRKFYELYVGGNQPIATEALARIKLLYAIEADMRGLPPQLRRAIRQERSKPIVEAMKPWLETSLANVPKGGKLGAALSYGLNQWDGLVRYLDDGRIEMDTNTVERSIRPLVMLESLCIPSSSVCKHWNRVVVSDATRATFSGHRRFDRLRRQVVGTNLVWRAGHSLHRWQRAGFDQAAYCVACGA